MVVVALEQWRVASGITEGAIFRPMDRHDRVASKQLSGEGVCLIVRERVQTAGIDPTGYSGHSLRAGLATSATQAGVSSWKIRQQTGHASDAMLSRYIRDGELFIGNAASALL
jgi:integrase